MELCDKSAAELARLLKKREISSRELTESVFKRIDEKESSINAYISKTKEIALKQADDADRRIKSGDAISPLNGIPVAVKDNLCTRGIKTTCASRILKNYIPAYNATAVQKAINNGAVIIGKTNLDEFGMGSSTENSIIGPTHNPINTDYVAGGSSGGSAAAVASGEAIIALGTDTGGSVRQPSAFCGITGIKPTYGRVSRYGLISHASSLDQIGVLGKNAGDCAIMLNTICGHDPKDSTSANIIKPDFTSSLDRGVRGIRAGLPKEYFTEGLDKGIRASVMDAVRLLEKEGMEIEEISLPHASYSISSYYLIATAEASSNLARYDGVKYGYRAETGTDDSVSMYESTRSTGFGNEVKTRIMLGTYVLSAGYYDAWYIKAQKVRNLVKRDFDRAFEKVDCIITPTTPCLPLRIGEKMADPLLMSLVDRYTVSLNLSGLPGISVNCGHINALPVGMQITGKAFDEEMVLRVASGYEKIAV